MTDLAAITLDDLDPATLALDALTDLIWARILTRLDAQVVEAPERLLTAAEVAGRAAVNIETVYRAGRSRALRAGRAGRALRIDPADLSAWLSAGERPTRAPRPRARRSRAGRPLGDALASLDRNQTHDRGDTTR